jgi:RNA polymerase sigma-70 factor (ECF subfamily)
VAQAILKRIAAGDKTAVQDCLDSYGGLVWSLARRMSPNTNEAEDAVQEIFIDVWKNAARFDESQSSETTFVAMIARRRLIDRLRK